MQEATFAHVNAVAMIDVERGDRVVGVVRIESVEKVFRLISSVVSVGVFQKYKERFLRQVNAFGSQFKSDRHVQAIREHCLFVGPAIAVRVLINQKHVVRLGVTRLVMRIARQC